MYTLYEEENEISIKNDGKVVCEGIKPWVQLENGEVVMLEYNMYDGNSYVYFDNGKHIKMLLRFECKKNIIAVHVDAYCTQLSFPYSGMNYFSAECAVGLYIKGLGEIEGCMADYLFSEYWAKAYIGKEPGKVPEDTQALLWKNCEGYGYLLTVCDKEYKSVLKGDKNGGMILSVFSSSHGMNRCKSLAFLMGMGKDPFSLTEDVTAFGMELLNNGAVPRKERRYPEIFNYLGWCSWDAFQLSVNHQGLLDKAEELKKKDIPVRWFIVDDMWAEVKNNISTETFHSNTLYSFEADHLRFPDGLHAAISDLKNDYGLKIGMWHPTTGYWRGIDPEGDIAREHGDLLCTTGDGRLIPDPSLEKSFLFYNAFHEFLKQCGTDFVKIDNQSFLRGYLKYMLPVGTAARQIHRAIEASVGVNFDNNLINCMGMAVENLWNRPVSAISRCSDDFIPENRQWFIKHILQCSYNSFVQGSFLWCDWDMWWSDDEQAVKNSVLRAICGGPVYVSDKLGRSVKEAIMPLVFSDGLILKCDKPAVPTADCLIVDAQSSSTAFKVWNTANECGIIAAFNLDENEKPVHGQISSDDIPTLKGEEFLLFEYFSCNVTVLDKNEALTFMLMDHDDFRLWVMIPIVDGFAPVGLADKYISPATFERIAPRKMLLKEGGSFAFFSKAIPDKVFVDGKEVKFCSRNNLYYVYCEKNGGRVFVEILGQ